MKRKTSTSSLKVAAIYIGTVVGAGFATGQEILQFFVRFGIAGIAGVMLATILFIFFGYIIMNLGLGLHARSHLEIIKFTSGKVIGNVIDIIVIFFLFGSLSAMLAGTGALFEQQFHLPKMLGNVAMCIIASITVITGIQGIFKSTSIIVPFLIISFFAVSTLSIFQKLPDLKGFYLQSDNSGVLKNWFLSCILYVSYNTIISISVLGPVGYAVNDKKIIRDGAILGGIGLGLSGLMIFLALSLNMSEVSHLEVPMIYLAADVSTLMQSIYLVVLLAAIYTTAVSCLYGFITRISKNDVASLNRALIIFASAFGALLASQFGFSNLVKYMYPVVGTGGLLLLASMVIIVLRKSRH